MITLDKYETLTLGENTWHGKDVFPGGKNIEVTLGANQFVSYLKVWMSSNNHVLKDCVYYLLELKVFLLTVQ